MSETTRTARRSSASRGTARPGAGIDDPSPRRRGIRLRFPISGDSFGRGAEAFARFMGTPAFLVGMTVFCAVWLAWNTFMPEAVQFDPRSLNFTLLTLILSLQASYAAPLLLLSDNRQADRDRVQAEQDRQSNERNHATTDFITREIATLRLALSETATRDFVRGELRDLLEEIQADPGSGRAINSGRAIQRSSFPDPAPAPAPAVDPESLRTVLREEIAAALAERDAAALQASLGRAAHEAPGSAPDLDRQVP